MKKDAVYLSVLAAIALFSLLFILPHLQDPDKMPPPAVPARDLRPSIAPPTDGQIEKSIKDQREKNQRFAELKKERAKKTDEAKTQIIAMDPQALAPPSDGFVPDSSAIPSEEVLEKVKSGSLTVR